MASRESRGLHAALIIFALLTVVFGVFFFIYWRLANEKINEANVQRQLVNDRTSERDRAVFQVNLLKYFLGYGDLTKAEIDTAMAGQTTDAALEEIKRGFEADMILYGEGLPEQERHYRSLPKNLLASIQSKNVQVVDRTASETDASTKMRQAIAEEQQKSADTMAQLEGAKAQYLEERTRVNAQLSKLQQDQDVNAQAIQRVNRDLAAAQAAARQQVDELSAELTKKDSQIGTLQDKLASAEVTVFEIEAGQVVYASQKSRTVWINLGSADKLRTHVTFSVYDKDVEVMSEGNRKARIEVVQILDQHLAEARILEDQISNPVLTGDKVHSPAWQPGMAIHFALAGFMDLNDDRRSDREYIRNLIFMNGGEIDAELKDDGTAVGRVTSNTRYLVTGAQPDENSSPQMIAEWNNLVGAAKDLQIKEISLNELLSLMGWKPDARTIKLGYGADTDDSGFRRREPPVGGAGTSTSNP